MKLHLGIILVGSLIIATGCARKCQTCSSTQAPLNYGTASYSAPATTTSYSAPVTTSNQATAQTAQYDSAPEYKYAKK